MSIYVPNSNPFMPWNDKYDVWEEGCSKTPNPYIPGSDNWDAFEDAATAKGE